MPHGVGRFLHQNDLNGDPGKAKGLGGERRSIKASKFSRVRGNAGCGECDDAVQGYFDNYTT